MLELRCCDAKSYRQVCVLDLWHRLRRDALGSLGCCNLGVGLDSRARLSDWALFHDALGVRWLLHLDPTV